MSEQEGIQTLDSLVGALREAWGVHLSTSRHIAARHGGGELVGYDIQAKVPGSALIEVWQGEGGWHVFVDDALDIELPNTLASWLEVSALVRSVVAYGGTVSRNGARNRFATGQQPITESVVKSWAGLNSIPNEQPSDDEPTLIYQIPFYKK